MNAGRTVAGNRRMAAIAVLTLAAVVLFARAGSGTGQAIAPGTGPLPELGPGDSQMVVMGAGAAASPAETWGYRSLPLTVGQVNVGSRELELAPPADPADPDPQLVFVRNTEATGWQIYDTPVDESNDPYRGMVPNRLSARITATGGGVLVGRDVNRDPADQVVVVHHDPGGPWRVLDDPPPGILLPASGGDPAEDLAEDRGAGAVAISAFDEGGATGLFAAALGRETDTAIVHFDGTTWTREPVEVPLGSESDFQIVAVEATGVNNAWALAIPDPALGRSVVLLERTDGGGGPEWVERDLGATPFENSDSAPDGLAAVTAAGGAAQPLTVTSEGVWIDLAATINGAAANATVYFDSGAGSVTGEWCDAPVCQAALGAQLSRQGGYRSFAWSGPGFGTRVITNPLDPAGAEDSNYGTYLRFADGEFARTPGGGASFRPSGGFLSVDAGWLEGPVQISGEVAPARLRSWPISSRAPLTDSTTAPGEPAGALGSAALAVGLDGSVARYQAGVGWEREFLLTSSGAVNRASLRGVAWPEANRAHAVGDLGAMWQWNADDGLWSVDPGAPYGFEGNLMDVAFDPADPSRGYAVGRRGVLLEYGKSWEQMNLPAGFESADLTSIAFAGSQAIVAAGGDLLINDGGGWRVDSSARALLDEVRAGDPLLFAVAALPDGGAVAAGRDIVIERDGPNSPWRFSDQPLPGSTVIAAAAVRPPGAGGEVRAIVSVVPQLPYPPADDLPEQDPDVPPPILPPFALPGDGYILRETESGWTDEQRTAFGGSTADRPRKTDPTLSFLLDQSGEGWAIGGWSGNADAAGRGTSSSAGRTIRTRVRTGVVNRFGAGQVAGPPATGSVPVPEPAGPVRFAVTGHAQCESTCYYLAPQQLGPDRTLGAALETVAGLAGAQGPRALLYTGNRVQTGLTPADAGRYADLLASGSAQVPVYPALGSNDVAGGGGATAFQSAFAGFPAPLGGGAEPAGVSTAGIPGAAPGVGARTHYAFDTSGPGGAVRVVVIDNSAGSLAASDPHQNPAEPQLPWLQAVLADARQDQIPVIVMGNRSLNPNFTPRLNVATDGNQVAQVLVDGGASAYVFDRPEENRSLRIPAGAQNTIPSFGTGTLGYRSELKGVIGAEAPDSLFGDAGVLLLELDPSQRDPQTNIAPVTTRLIPVISDLSLEATDGTLVRRSRVALFRGLGRRPPAGDRWGRASAGSGNPDPSGGDPYTQFPPDQCVIAGCSARIPPEYTFTSSDPDLADFVKQDPQSTNLRKPFIDENDDVVTDNTSGLLCAFNAGTTTVTVSAGGYSYSQKVNILDGSVQRPCGTRPLDPSRFPPNEPSAAPPPPPSPQPQPNPTPTAAPPPPPGTTPPAPTPPAPPAATPNLPNPPSLNPSPSSPPPPSPFLPAAAAVTAAFLPVIVPPPPPPAVRPTPPGGAPARVYQVEEEKEEEVALEESQAFSRFPAQDRGVSPHVYVLAVVLLAALAGAGMRPGPRARRRVHAAPALNGNPSTTRRRT